MKKAILCFIFVIVILPCFNGCWANGNETATPSYSENTDTEPVSSDNLIDELAREVKDSFND